MELWEIVTFVEKGIEKENEEVRRSFHIARLGMSAMTDVSKLKFEWELEEVPDLETKAEDLRVLLAKNDSRHKRRIKRRKQAE